MIAAIRGAVGLFKYALGIGQVDEPERVRRLSLCAQCPNRSPRDVCRVCGCYLPAKASLAAEHCPERVW